MFPITVTINNRAEFDAVHNALYGAEVAPAASAPTPPPAKKRAAAPAPTSAAPAPAPAVVTPAPAPAPAKGDDGGPIAKVASPADIKAAGEDLTALADFDPAGKTGRSAAVAILQEFGATKMTSITADKIPAFHAKVKAKLAELTSGGSPSLI